MNYAWANPLTGIREQTFLSFSADRRSEDSGKALQEAKVRVWGELQEQEADGGYGCMIWRQEPIGRVGLEGPFVDPAIIVRLNAEDPASYTFAYADPDSGSRIVVDEFPGFLVENLKRLQDNRDSKNEVIVYATWPECTVNRSDPRPEAPVIDDDDEGDVPVDSEFRKRKTELDEIAVLDDQTRCSLITAWALLDIAETLRNIECDALYPTILPKRFRSGSADESAPGFWGRFKRWILGDARESDLQNDRFDQ